jgi:hypothetical protein
LERVSQGVIELAGVVLMAWGLVLMGLPLLRRSRINSR